MTLTTTARAVTAVGNGSTTEWPFSFKIPSATQLIVKTFDTVSLALDTISSADYTVVGIGDADGGTVTYPLVGDPITSTIRLIILRTVPFTQTLDIQNQGGFFPNVVEDQLDLIVMQIQQNDETIGRGIVAPVGDNITDFTLPLNDARASKYLFFGSDGSVGVTGTAPAVQYQGAFNDAGEPTLRLSGSALQAGDLYFNTTSDVFKAYDGTNWITAITILFDDVVRTPAAVITSASNAVALSMTGANKKTLALDENTTITVSGEVADQVVELWITQGATGGTAAWSGVDKWLGGLAPTLSTTEGRIDIIILSSASDGTTIVAQHLGVAS